MSSKASDASFPFNDIPELTEVLADSLWNSTVESGIARFTFAVSRPDPEPQGNPPKLTGTHVPVARLAMPLQTMVSFYNHLARMVAHLEQEGVLRREGESVTLQ